jgi:phytoene synthase
MMPGLSESHDAEWLFPNKATPLGSPAYYAVRFSPESQRHRNAMLLAWLGEIEAIADRPHDPGVARLRLDWWRNEIATLDSSHGARHPLLLGMREQGIDGTAVTDLHGILDAAESRIVNASPASDTEFADQCRGGMGKLFRLLAMLDRTQAADPAACEQAGGYCAAVRCVQRLAELTHRFPTTVQAQHLQRLEPDQRRERIDALLATFRHAQPGSRLPPLATRLFAMQQANHRKMRRMGYPLDKLVDRPPIAHLWTAWRCR